MSHRSRLHAPLNRLLILALLLLPTAVSACRRPDLPLAPGSSAGLAQPDAAVPAPPAPLPQIPSPSPPPSPTTTPTSTPSPTPTATPTPTPTPTAVPASVSGNPWAGLPATPAPRSGAPCGIVDWLDFPLDPPEADLISSGGRDFGVFRARYDQYHAGEDWWIGRGTSFGEPVFSIGHGSVTYAEPNGWGRDQGVVIVRHVFADGRSFLSFYGHLDPPSVSLRAGECIARGEQVGEIGRPRTGPHLHFEIRTHLPTQPGPGYWPDDPTLAGWLPPSQTIWHERIRLSPGVVWATTGSGDGRQLLSASPDSLLFLHAARVLHLDTATGAERRRSAELDGVVAAALSADQTQLFGADRAGRLAAYAAPLAGSIDPDPLWELALGRPGMPRLLPTPDGGVLVALRSRLYRVTRDGALRWPYELNAPLLDWLHWNGQILLTTSGSGGHIWRIDGEEPPAALMAASGYLYAAPDTVWLHAADGLYRLPADLAGAAERVYALPQAAPPAGGLTVLPDGSVLLVHADLFDRRLIRINTAGAVVWQVSLRALPRGEASVWMSLDAPYLMLQAQPASATRVEIYAINPASGALTRLFTGGTRTARSQSTWIAPVAGRLLLSIGGGDLLLLDPGAAQTAVSSSPTP